MVSAVAESHPRIKARREALHRDGERRKWLRTGALLLLLAVPIGVLALARTSVLDVDRVAIEGASRADAATLESLVGIDDGIALVDVDLAGVERRIERHPWVADATARRAWPDTLEVSVTERIPVAATPIDGGSSWLLVDLDAMALDIVARRPTSLPVVVGADSLAAPGRRVADLDAAVLAVDALPQDLAQWVLAVEQRADRHVVLQLTDGVTADLGTADRLADKLVALATLLTRVQTDCIESFNVQAPDAPVVTRC
ncbi:MAG: FtsQ-type POTRA domain-containing protein [Acidimicrobiia bacterium]|nr:FtsQ-type POTRA domain-containing protein [Acidimicrobiia bacterium]